jgi:hypothetical protein
LGLGVVGGVGGAGVTVSLVVGCGASPALSSSSPRDTATQRPRNSMPSAATAAMRSRGIGRRFGMPSSL